jgi:ankyrin repeat protein
MSKFSISNKLSKAILRKDLTSLRIIIDQCPQALDIPNSHGNLPRDLAILSQNKNIDRIIAINKVSSSEQGGGAGLSLLFDEVNLLGFLTEEIEASESSDATAVAPPALALPIQNKEALTQELVLAVRAGNIQQAQILIARGAPIDAEAFYTTPLAEAFYTTPLAEAARTNQLDLFKFLLELGADPFFVYNLVDNPCSFKFGQSEEMRSFLRDLEKTHSAIPEIAMNPEDLLSLAILRNANGIEFVSANHFACKNSRGNSLEELRALRADADRAGTAADYEESLINCIKIGDLQNIEKLVATYPQLVSAPLKHNATALMYAAYEGQLEICRFLLELGAEVNKTNNSMMTAAAFAAKKGHQDIAQLIKKFEGPELSKTIFNTPIPFEQELLKKIDSMVQKMTDSSKQKIHANEALLLELHDLLADDRQQENYDGKEDFELIGNSVAE